MHPNVLQHQYAISKGSEILSTKGILICTGWYGWDAASGIRFLCHFDHPCSAKSVPQFLRDLRNEVPENHKFQSVLVGGKEWFWSSKTRAEIRRYVDEQTALKIKVREGPIDGKCCRHRDLLISAKGRHMKGQDKLTGRSIPRGFFWCKPMERVRT